MPGRSSLAALLALGLLAAPAGASAGPGVRSPVALANHCFALSPVARAAAAGPFFLKPTGLGTYLLLDPQGRLLRVRGGRAVRAGGPETAARPDEWAVATVGPGAFTIRSTLTRRALTHGLEVGRPARFAFVPARGCARFPEAEVGVSGAPSATTRRDGTVIGFSDTHLHITADMRAGGRVIHGAPFDRFGITRALGGDARDHGADGSLDVTGNLLRSGLPFGKHDTQGWPGFRGWPIHDTFTHQQIYWVWLQRAWRAGLRLVVAQTVEDDELCRIELRHAHSCDEPRTVALEVRRLRALEDYIDAQAGGRGRGWFRLVYDPGQARRVIASGKLAVVIGVESSNPFGCSVRPGGRRCTRADVDRGVEAYRRLGVRSLFIAHWFDNAFTGAALEGATKGKFINAMNRLETGHYFATEPCPAPGQGEEIKALSPLEIKVLSQFFPATRPLLRAPTPTYPTGRRCNARGLTSLGAYLVRRLVARHMLIEVDHLSEKARDRVLAIARGARYPVISSHTGTGGTWSPAELRRLYGLGGLASATPAPAPELVAKVLRQGRYSERRFFYGMGLGTDTGGFSALPGPRADADTAPLRYPFRSTDGSVTFRRERTGTRTFDLNADGIAHYGLVADLVADMHGQKRGDTALRVFFRSAEAYLEMWQRADTPRKRP